MCSKYLAPSGTYRMKEGEWRIQYPMAGTYLYALFRWNLGLGWVFDRYLTDDEAGRFYE